MNTENKNLLLATVACVLIFVGFHFFYEKPRMEQVQQQVVTQNPAAAIPELALAPTLTPLTNDQALKASPRVSIKTSLLKGSISLKGARIDDLILTKYHETTNPDSSDVALLAPAGTEHSYYLESGWILNTPNTQLPDSQSVWSASQALLTPETPVTLSWTNSQGVTFEKIISVDDKYMFTVKERIRNNSGASLVASPYGLISRKNPEVSSASYALHEGAVGYLDNKLQEIKYKSLDDDKKETYSNTKGWLGLTDKYWLTALIPDQAQNVTAAFRSTDEGASRYQADFLSSNLVVPANSSAESSYRFFAGAKAVELLDAYEKDLGIPHFDLAVDFGWFYFITKPLFFVLEWLHGFLGNFGLAIIALTIMIRTLLFPLANKSFKSMAKMRSLQPELNRMKEQCGDDKVKFNQEMMAFYKKNKVNPVSGCLPMVLQIPVLFAIYKVLLISIEMRHAPFYGWIHDLSAPDPTTLFNLFGLIPWTPPSFLMIGALPILMGGTMFLQQKMSPQSLDPIQAKMFLIMPILFTYMLGQFPAGVVLYWTCTNLLAILQQWGMTKLSEGQSSK